jgi:hypothetical protein
VNLGEKSSCKLCVFLHGGLHPLYTSLYLHYIHSACVVALVTSLLMYLASYLLACVAISIPFAWLIWFV